MVLALPSTPWANAGAGFAAKLLQDEGTALTVLGCLRSRALQMLSDKRDAACSDLGAATTELETARAAEQESAAAMAAAVAERESSRTQLDREIASRAALSEEQLQMRAEHANEVAVFLEQAS